MVTTFEIGNDEGDTPGEFQEWVEKIPLQTILPFPQGYHHLRYNAKKQVLGIVAGEGPARMASSITALVNDPRFDFSHSYWLMAGVAGVDPNISSVASAAWVRHVVDGDLAYEIDAREIPSEWSTGHVPFDRNRPYQAPRPPVRSDYGTKAYTLNAELVDWAYSYSSKHSTLSDDDNLQRLRSRYIGLAKAQQAPAVIEGDVLASGTFFIGRLSNAWAETWVAYWTLGEGVFAMSDEEDAAFMQALTFLGQTGRVDMRRVMILRAASNFTSPPPGQTAAALLASEASTSGLSGLSEALNSTFTVGGAVVEELSRNWRTYGEHIPNSIP